jgi:predicted glycoside hydrolase/deacetylase ChbG (UPF0249 family)
MTMDGPDQPEPELVPIGVLAITADDYGYAAAYDTGIAIAARAGVVDRVSVMAMRRCDPEPLLEAGVTLGLHLEQEPEIAVQLLAFDRLIGSPPAYIDGHRHCHADQSRAFEVARVAAELRVPVRAVSASHRALLRSNGVATTDHLVGRMVEDQPPLPGAIARWLEGRAGPLGATEWMVHPGLREPLSGSSYDAGRPEDLALLLELGDRARWASAGIARAALPEAVPI